METKQELMDYFHQLYDELIKYRECGNGRFNFGTSASHYDRNQAQIEGFLRTLWAAGPLMGSNQLSIEDINFYRSGILNGVDPSSEYYWGTIHDYDQLIVECTSLAITLIETKEILWCTFTEREQYNVYTWLNQINQVKIWDNNWRFFRILVNVAFIKLERNFSEKRLAEDKTVINSFYVGKGWYVDGNSHQRDYYIPWAFHYYGLLYAYYMAEIDPETAKIYCERSKQFATSFINYFNDQGAAVPFGRSLTYRFAMVSFFQYVPLQISKPFHGHR